MTDVRWSKDAPKASGWYWIRMWDFKLEESALRVSYWNGKDICVGVDSSHVYSRSYVEFGPPIPSPEVLAEVAEFLRVVGKPNGYLDLRDDARALLAKLEAAP